MVTQPGSMGAGPSRPDVRSLSCPSCGGDVTLRTGGHAVNVVCSRCNSVLDATDPALHVLQRASQAMRTKPLIPLGSRGTLHGHPWEVVGFQLRSISVEGVRYSWHEYLLFNPYRGFRYLTHYQGHWSDVVVLRAFPDEQRVNGRPQVWWKGTTFAHFQEAQAETSFVLGEFPWEVRVGDRATVSDFVAPPRMVSKETTQDEISWSLGAYTTGETIWKAFRLQGTPPPTVGVYASQPSPHVERSRGMWALFIMLFVALAVMLVAANGLTAKRTVLDEEHLYVRPADTVPEDAWVSEPFDLGGRTSNVEVRTQANVNNGWLYFRYALIEESSGRAFDFGRELSYYSGVDQGEAWSEGSRSDRTIVPSVPAGRYYLRVAVEGAPDIESAGYAVTLRRDVPLNSYFLIALLALLVPPAIATMQHASFESSRWSESDYPPTSSSDDEEEE